MRAVSALGLRMERRRLQIRAFRKRCELTCSLDQTAAIGAKSVLAFVTLRNEKPRLPYFLNYYRKLGVDHFLFVDNGSGDGRHELLSAEPDVSPDVSPVASPEPVCWSFVTSVTSFSG